MMDMDTHMHIKLITLCKAIKIQRHDKIGSSGHFAKKMHATLTSQK